MLSGLVGKAQNAPDVSGIWVRGGSLSIKLEQSGEKVTVTCNTAAYHHTGTLQYRGNDIFKGTLERKNVSTGCVTYLSWAIEYISDTKLRQSEGGLDSNCDLTPAYKADNLIMTKQ